MKKNFKRWLALMLAVVMVVTTCMTHTDGFLRATDGAETETAQTVDVPADPAVTNTTDGEGAVTPDAQGETDPQLSEPTQEVQEIVIPKQEPAAVGTEGETIETTETTVNGGTADENAAANEATANGGSADGTAPADGNVTETVAPTEKTEGQEVEVVPSDKKENLYNVVFHKPAVNGGKLYVWEEGQKKEEASYKDGKFVKEVKEGTTLCFEIKTTENFSVEKVTDKSGEEIKPEKATKKSSVYKMVVEGENEITILYKEETKGKENMTQDSAIQDVLVDEKVEKPAQTLKTSTSDGATIVVTSPEGALPEGAKVTAVPVLTEEVEGAVEEAVKAEGKVLVSMKAYDITIIDANGNIIQPDENVKVTIKNTGVKGDETSVYHVDNNNANKLTDVSSAKAATFSAEHFSIYVVAGSEEVDPEAETLTVKINYLYESGAIAQPSFTMVIEKTGENYTVNKEIPEIKGYTPVIEGESEFAIEDGTLTGTFTDNTPQIVDIVYQANPTTYTVRHLFEDLEGNYIEDEKLKEKLDGNVGALTEAKEKAVEGFTAQTIEQQEIKEDETTVVEIKYDRNDYTLTYMTLGGSYVASVTKPYETEVTLVSGEGTPTRKGYTFAGWYMDDKCTEKATSPLKLTEDTKVYAKWDGAVVDYKVVYLTENADDDNYSYAGTVTLKAKAGTEVTANARTNKPSGFDTEHFAFKEATTATVNADGSTVINVKYSRNKYTITFKGTGQYICGKEEHKHSRWTGCYNWRGELTCKKQEHIHNEQCKTNDITITAKYEQNIKDLWNAAVGPGTKYEGMSWKWDGDQSTGFQSTMPGKDKVVSKSNNNGTTKRVLTYYIEDPNGQISYKNRNFSEYTTVVLKLSEAVYPTFNEEFFVIDGYDRFGSTIKQWENGQMNGSDRGSWNTREGNKFYYTRFGYTLELINGSNSKKISVPYQSDISQYLVEPDENPLGDGSFDGWYLDPSFQQKYDGDNKMPKNLVLYAKWNPVTYTVKFVDPENETQVYDQQTIESKGMVEVPNPPEKQGYIFKGWYSDNECTNTFDFASQITENTTVYAKWIANEYTTYTVEYVTDKGETVHETETHTGKVGATVKAEAKQALGKYEKYTVDAASKTIVLRADAKENVIQFVYKKIGELKYKVQYVYGEKIIITSEEQKSEANYIKVVADKALIPGYTLKQNYQWVTLTAGENIVTFECEPATYTIKYLGVENTTWGEANVNQNPNPTEYVYNAKDITLVAPKRDDQVFIGWEFTSTDGEVKTNDHSPANTVINKGSYGNLEFTARWATLTATGYDGKYDGQPHVASASVNGAEGFTIYYSTDDGKKWSETAPSITNVGTVNVKVKAVKTGYNTLTVETTLNITPAEVTVTAENQTKVFGTTDPKFTAKTTGTYGTDTVTYTLSRENGENVGTYTITPAGKELQGNYKVTYKTGTLTITQATRPEGQQLSVTSYDGTYDAKAHSITVNNLQNGDKVEYSYDDGKTWVASKEEYTNVTKVAQKILVKVTNNNYTPAETRLTGTVTIKPFEVTVKATNAGKVYGEKDPKLAVTIAPEVRPDNQEIQYTVAREAGEDVKEYQITVTAEADQGNYKVATENGTFTISPQARPEDAEHKLSVTSYDGVYDGGNHTITVNNQLEGDVVTYSYDDGATYVSELREYKDVTNTPIKVKVTNLNYTPNEVVLDGYVKVTPATIKVTANNNGKVIGQADPTLTYEVTQDSTVTGEKAAFSGNVVRAEGEEAGNYDILAGSLALINNGAFIANNYTLVVSEGMFTIEDAKFSVEKTLDNKVTSENPFKVGDVAEFTITVKNNNKYDIENVVVKDVLTGGAGTVLIYDGEGYTVDGTTVNIPKLEAEQTLIIKVTYTVTQADIDNQSQISNVATVESNGVTPKPSEPVEVPVETQKADFTSTKAITNLESVENGKFKVGETVKFDITVSNTGNVTLNNVNVKEELLDAKIVSDGDKYIVNEDGTATIPTLGVNQEVVVKAEYTIKQSDIDNGTVKNFVTVEGEGTNPDPENPDPNKPNPDKETPEVDIPVVEGVPAAVTNKVIVNAGNGTGKNGTFAVGDVVEFNITVENTGNVTLKNVVVEEQLEGAEIIERAGYTVSTDGKKATISAIEVGATATVEATYTVTQNDLDKGSVKNIAGVKVPGKEEPQKPEIEIPIEQRDPKYVVNKTLTNEGTGKNGAFKVGEKATFDITVRNTGNVTLKDVKVAEQLKGAEIVTGEGYTINKNGTVATIESLPVGASIVVKAEYVITQTDVDHGGVTNSIGVEGNGPGENPDPIKPDPDPEKPSKPEEPIPTEKQEPKFEASKKLTNGGKDKKFKVGEKATFDITVQNTGNVTLKNVKVTEQLEGAVIVAGENYTVKEDGTVATIETLPVGKSIIVKAEYVITQKDVDNGGARNSVIVTGNGPVDPEGKPVDPKPVDPGTEIPTEKHNPKFESTKVLTNKGTGEDGKFKVGETAKFDITVKNTGNVTLTNVKVTENLKGAEVVAGEGYEVVDGIAMIDEIKVGKSIVVKAEYVITQKDVDNGGAKNSVTVTGNGPVDPEGKPVDPENPDPKPVKPGTDIETEKHDPKFEAEKVLTNEGTGENGNFKVGETAKFDIKVKNTGNVTLTNIKVTEQLEGAKVVSGEGYEVVDGVAVIDEIPVGETAVVKAEYVITQADVDNNGVTNKVKVEGNGPVDPEGKPDPENPDPKPVDPEEPIPTEKQDPKFESAKTLSNKGTAENGKFKVGDTSKFDITVKNTGNVTLKDITVKENLEGAKIVQGEGYKVNWNGTATIQELPVGATVVVKAEYVITQADVDNGGAYNSVTVEGEGPGGEKPEKPDPEPENPNPNPEPEKPGTEIPTEDKDPKMEVVKTVTSSPREDGEYRIGDRITYQITVTNSGNITLNNVVVTDTLNATGQVTWDRGIETNSKNEALINAIAPGETVTLGCSYVVVEADEGKDLVNTAVGDSDETTPTAPSTTNPTEVEEYYNLTINYVYADGTTAAPSVRARYLEGETFGYTSPTINGYTPDYAFVRSDANGMPARDVVFTVVYTAIPAVPASPTTPSDGTPNGGNATTNNASVGGNVTANNEPVGAELRATEDDMEVVPVVEEKVPLAKRNLDDHECCILHFLIMLIALIIYAAYTRSMKKRQERIAELADELEMELLKRSQGEAKENVVE